MDPNNLVVKICVAGMQAENEGKSDDARKLFEKAWEMSQDNYEACIAAHYLARHQDNSQATFDWNKKALNRANALDDNDDRVQNFYPSLYLNMGYSYEGLGNLRAVRKYYEMAADKLSRVPDGAYKDIVRNGITGGYERTKPSEV